jgi:dihydrofolate reductase
MPNGIKVTLLMALTVDGKIARDAEHYTDWTEKEDKRFFKTLSQKAGVVIMGSKTFDTIGKPLPNRKNIVLTRRERLSDRSDLLFTAGPLDALLRDLRDQGFHEAIVAGGAVINTLFAQQNLVDDIIITVSPRIFGAGLSLFSEPILLDLDLKGIQRLGLNSVVLHYQVKRPV